MKFIEALKRLWRGPAFRRMFLVRVLGQAGDGTLQVGMASYLLFSAQSQATAWAVAGVLAITLLPYTIIGPFVSTFLDTWSRRNVVLYSELMRAVLSLGIGALIWFGLTDGGWAFVLFGALLVANSLNRFMLAALSAGLEHTVEPDEYVTASAIVPTVGPLGVVIGAGIGFGARLSLGGVLGSAGADAVVFATAAVLFGLSILLCAGFSTQALGPEPDATRGTVVQAVKDLVDAFGELRRTPAAGLALIGIPITRLLFGLLSVGVIVAMRNFYHPADQPEAAIADITVWGVFTGAGFVLAAPLVPLLVGRIGVRNSAIVTLIGCAAAQAMIALTDAKIWLFVMSFFVGLGVQGYKICVDAIIQAHVAEQYKGRVFTIYDMAFNAAFVFSGVVAALVLPGTGLSPTVWIVAGGCYLAFGAWFAVASTRIGRQAFEEGSGDLTAAAT